MFTVDEDNDIPSTPSCNGHEFMCQTDRFCIDIRRKCDGLNDCSDHSDERECGIHVDFSFPSF